MQVQICRLFVADKRGIVEKVFTDPGEAVDSADRPGLAAALVGAGNGAFSNLVVMKPDRLSQDPETLAAILAELADAGTTVWTVQKKRRLKVTRKAEVGPLSVETGDEVAAT